MKRQWILAAAATALFSISPAWAQHSHGKHDAEQSSVLADGEVRKVDKSAGKITLKHGPIKSLDMPAMTMVYQVKDPAMLGQVKEGDKVRFSAEMRGSAMIVTRIEPAK
jgi:Cu(I)/Ag(I) efflux system periplasmic protein CusF